MIDDEDPLAGPNQGKKTKRRRTKESESSKKPSTTKETPKGKASSKGSKTGKSASTKESVEEPIAKVVMDDAFNTVGEDVVHDDDQPQDTSEPKTNKTLNQDWFKQPPRPPTPNPEWNKHKLDWNNPEGDHYPFDLSKPLPLQGRQDHLTVVVDYFFNNDLEYLKTSDLEKTYTTSITKTKAARYDIIEGDFVDLHLNDIEDMMILSVQHKLFHLNESDIVEFIVALHMFIRSLIIKRRIEELQLVLRGALKKVWDELHHIIFDFHLGYNDEMSRRKRTTIDKKRSELMVELIDKQMRERSNFKSYLVNNGNM
ncbi:hypothetical protein Tco_0590685 [Tanacetum coccineum]